MSASAGVEDLAFGHGHLAHDLLEAIGAGRITDDANLSHFQHEAARWLYRNGFINGAPLEGSDAPVDALWITDKGRELLARGGEI